MGATKRHCRSFNHTSNMAYWTIRMMHDNPILPLVRNPYKLLKDFSPSPRQKPSEMRAMCMQSIFIRVRLRG
jgi:hypothetical protein